MTKRFFAVPIARIPGAVCLLAATLVLASCGGGGGGDAPRLTLQLSPASVSVDVITGQQETFQTVGTVGGTVDGVVNVLVEDAAGVLDPSVEVTQVGATQYAARFRTAGGLAINTYTGTFVIRLCGSGPPTCSPQYATADLAYTINVVPEPPPPPPVLTGVSPSQSVAGNPGFVMTVAGSNFRAGSVVYWDGSPRPTSFLGPSTLQAVISADDVADGGAKSVVVMTPMPGAASSGSLIHTVVNPVPSLVLVSPVRTTAGCGPFTLTVTGAGFVPSSVVRWQGSALATSFVSPTALRATVPAGLIASEGSGSITVSSPLPVGGVTAARPVTVTASSAPTTPFVARQNDAGHTGVGHNRCPDSPSPLWDIALDGNVTYPLIAGGRVFVTVPNVTTSQTTLLALDADTGAVLWGPVVVAGEPAFFGRAEAAYDNGTVFVAANVDPALPVTPSSGYRPGSVQAYSAATGALLWRAPVVALSLTSDLVGPVATNGRVYVGGRTDSARLFAFDQATGAAVFAVSSLTNSPALPAVAANAVVVSTPCETAAFHPASGASLWVRPAGCSGGGAGLPILTDGLVYSDTTGLGELAQVYALADGSSVGEFPRNRDPAIRAGVSYGRVRFTDALRAAVIATDDQLWSFTEPGFGVVNTSVQVVDDLVIAGNRDNGTLYALDAATGRVAWTLTSVQDTPGAAAGDNLLVVPAGNRLKAWRVGTDQ